MRKRKRGGDQGNELSFFWQVRESNPCPTGKKLVCLPIRLDGLSSLRVLSGRLWSPLWVQVVTVPGDSISRRRPAPSPMWSAVEPKPQRWEYELRRAVDIFPAIMGLAGVTEKTERLTWTSQQRARSEHNSKRSSLPRIFSFLLPFGREGQLSLSI